MCSHTQCFEHEIRKNNSMRNQDFSEMKSILCIFIMYVNHDFSEMKSILCIFIMY